MIREEEAAKDKLKLLLNLNYKRFPKFQSQFILNIYNNLPSWGRQGRSCLAKRNSQFC